MQQLLIFLRIYKSGKKLDDNSIDCVVTSPPYWGLRDYGTASYEGGDPNFKHTITDGIVDNKNNDMRIIINLFMFLILLL